MISLKRVLASLSRPMPFEHEFVRLLVPEKPGIYLLTLSNSVIYCGRSDKNLCSRLASHLNSDRLSDAETFSFLVIEKQIERFRAEEVVIRHFGNSATLRNMVRAAAPSFI